MTPAEAAAALAACLEAENARLAALDLAAAGRLLADKTRALAAFLAAAGPPPPRAGIERLRTLTLDNRRLLEQALLVQGRVLGTLARAVPRALAQQAGGYGRTGANAHPRLLPAVALSTRA